MGYERVVDGRVKEVYVVQWGREKRKKDWSGGQMYVQMYSTMIRNRLNQIRIIQSHNHRIIAEALS